MHSLQTDRHDLRLCLHPDFRLDPALPHHDIIADARAAHELLDLVRQLAPIASQYGTNDPDVATIREAEAALASTAPWLSSPEVPNE